MSNWFRLKIAYLRQVDNGSVIKKSETYLLNAMSFIEAETRLQMILESYIPEYDLSSIAKVKMTDAAFHESEETWYQTDIAFVSYDEDSGNEKKIKEMFMIAAGDVKEVYERMHERMEGSIVDWEITSIKKTDVLDIFPYEDGQIVESSDDVEASE
jgi:hypothetical protein